MYRREKRFDSLIDDIDTIFIQSKIKISDMKIPMLSSFEAAKIPNRSDPLPLLNLRNFEQIGMIRMEFRGFRSIRKSESFPVKNNGE